MEVGVGEDTAKRKHASHSRGTFGPFLCEAEGEDEAAMIQKHGSVQVMYWEGGPHLLRASCWDLSVLVLSTLRRRPSKVFWKYLPLIPT